MSRSRTLIAAAAALAAALGLSPSSFANEPQYRLDARTGFLRLTRFHQDEGAPVALQIGVSGAAFFAPHLGAGASVAFSQPASFRVPCNNESICLRRYDRFGAFVETRWLRPDQDIAFEPWLRAGPSAVHGASKPSSPEGDPSVQWNVGGNGTAGADLRLRWLLLGVYGEATLATGDVGLAYGMGLRLGVALGAPEPK